MALLQGCWAEATDLGLRTVRRTWRAMGTEVTMVALHESRTAALRALDAAFAEVALVDELMSLYRPDSELSQLNRTGVVQHPHPHLVSVLERAQQLARRTAGAFDVTVQPLWRLYAEANDQGRLPDDAAIQAVRSRVDFRRLELTSSRLRLHGEGQAVTLNGIAQGFAADRALAALRAHGVRHALVNAGELGACGHNETGQDWTAGIRHPRRSDDYVSTARLDGRCMATSGDYATAFTPDLSSHHIFDPGTGRSPLAFSSVTVVAPAAVDADALSTAVFVLGLVKGSQLIQAWPRADALFVLKDGRVLATRGFPGAA
ncbi:FAD:protein FMN transferase [Ramlibacter solisilvae]